MIAFDASLTVDAGAGTSKTAAFTVGSGADRMLIVALYSDSGDLITGVTYNGVAMTQLVKRAGRGSEFIYLYYLANPTSGSNDIVVSASGSTYMFWIASSYTGVNQVSPIDNSTNTTGTTNGSGDFTVSLTTSADNCWLVTMVRGETSFTAITNSVLRGSASSTMLADTNATQTPAGSKSMTLRNTATTQVDALIASLRPNASSPSASLSPSSSISSSVSPSLSPSASRSPSTSISPSASVSLSQSPSASVSLSLSPSPSQGYSNYTRGDYSVLPVNNDDLENTYLESEETKLSTRNQDYVSQTGALQFMLHQFKNFVGGRTACAIEWEGMSTLAPEDSTVYLQVYNEHTAQWDTKAVNSEAEENQNFELEAKIDDLTNYKDEHNVITSRVYQLAI